MGNDTLIGTTDITKLSDTISRPLEKLFRVGGLALVFVFIGFLCMLAGYIYRTELSIWIFSVGATIVFCCLSLFLFSQLAGPVKAARLVRENKQMIDSVQEMAIKLTDSLGDVQALMFKHYQEVAQILEIAAPVLSEIPVLQHINFADENNVHQIIVDAVEKSKNVVQDVRHALVTCKITNLRQYLDDLTRIKFSIQEALRKNDGVGQTIAGYKATLTNLRDCLIEYLDMIDGISTPAIENLGVVSAALHSIKDIPFIGSRLENFGLSRAQNVSNQLLEGLKRAQMANSNLRKSLATGDAEALRACVQNIKALGMEFRSSTATAHTEFRKGKAESA